MPFIDPSSVSLSLSAFILTKWENPMSAILNVTDVTFDQLLQNDKPVLLDFWADWCQPCLSLIPVLENIATQYKNEILVAKLNVDENQQTPREYGIRSIPYLLLIQGGNIVDTLVGNQSKEKINSFLTKNLGYA